MMFEQSVGGDSLTKNRFWLGILAAAAVALGILLANASRYTNSRNIDGVLHIGNGFPWTHFSRSQGGEHFDPGCLVKNVILGMFMVVSTYTTIVGFSFPSKFEMRYSLAGLVFLTCLAAVVFTLARSLEDTGALILCSMIFGAICSVIAAIQVFHALVQIFLE